MGSVPEIVFEARLVLEDDCATIKVRQFGTLIFVFEAQNILRVHVADNEHVEQDG